MDDRGSPSGVTLHRFFLPPESWSGDEVAFPPEAVRQITRVLRMSTGDRVIVLDDTGREYEVTLTLEGATLTGHVERSRLNTAEPAIRLSLYLGVLKAAKLEMVLQKCTEIGVSRFIPVISSRSVPADPGAARQQRFETILREAAEQCRRGRIPQITGALSYSDALAQAAHSGPTVLLWEEEHAHPIDGVVFPVPTTTVNLFVGPEGGFSASEAGAASSAGAHLATLGPRILRAETAAIVGSAMLLAHVERAARDRAPRT